MDPIDGSLRAENIQRSRGVGDLNKLNASVGRVDPRLGICAFRPVGRWSVPIGQLRADNDNPAVRRELQNVAMLDVESAGYERRHRRQLRIKRGLRSQPATARPLFRGPSAVVLPDALRGRCSA